LADTPAVLLHHGTAHHRGMAPANSQNNINCMTGRCLFHLKGRFSLTAACSLIFVFDNAGYVFPNLLHRFMRFGIHGDWFRRAFARGNSSGRLYDTA